MDPVLTSRGLSNWRYGENGKKASVLSTARQLEGVFVGMMFEELAKGIDMGGGKSPGAELYHEWFRSAIADEFAASGGLGIGNRLAEQLSSGGNDESKDRKRVDNSNDYRPTFRRQPPVRGRVSSGFGPRVHPVSGEKSFHRGVDVAVPSGTPIVTPYNGRVTEVGVSKHLGKYIYLSHGGGFTTLYAHLSKANVRVGNNINSGTVIGSSGNTGRVTGPHLHFAIFENGVAKDPKQYVDL